MRSTRSRVRLASHSRRRDSGDRLWDTAPCLVPHEGALGEYVGSFARPGCRPAHGRRSPRNAPARTRAPCRSSSGPSDGMPDHLDRIGIVLRAPSEEPFTADGPRAETDGVMCRSDWPSWRVSITRVSPRPLWPDRTAPLARPVLHCRRARRTHRRDHVCDNPRPGSSSAAGHGRSLASRGRDAVSTPRLVDAVARCVRRGAPARGRRLAW